MTHGRLVVRLGLLLFVSLSAVLLTLPPAWSQGVPGGALPTPQGAPGGATAGAATGSWGGTLFVVGALIGLIVLVALIAKTYDLRKRREAEAVTLQSRLSDALLSDRSLDGATVTPTAHVPLWTGSPVTIEITGDISGPEARDRIVRAVEREARQLRSDIQVEDKLMILPPVAGRRAA